MKSKSYMPASHARAHFTRARLSELFQYDPASGDLSFRATGEVVRQMNNHGYLWVWVEGAALLVHRVIWRLMTGDWPSQLVDHLDGNRTNNRWGNLRPATHSTNAQNYGKAMRTNKTGFLGVCRDPRRIKKPFRAAIETNGKKRSLGVFATAEEAHAAYLAAKAIEHPGARLPSTFGERPLTLADGRGA